MFSIFKKTKEENKEDEENNNYYGIFVCTAVFIFLVIILYTFLVKWGYLDYLLPADGNKYGLFGDMFGCVNALFSGLAFAGIIWTIWLQRNELALQRKELEETRDVFKEEKNILKEQSKIQKEKAYETTLFHMINNIQIVIDNFSLIEEPMPSNPVSNVGSVHLGSGAFLFLFSVRKAVNQNISPYRLNYDFDPQDYKMLLKNNYVGIDLILLSIETIHQFIEEKFDDDLKRLYSEILTQKFNLIVQTILIEYCLITGQDFYTDLLHTLGLNGIDDKISEKINK